MNEREPLVINLSIIEMNTIIRGLQFVPYGEAAPIIESLQTQVSRHMSSKEPETTNNSEE